MFETFIVLGVLGVLGSLIPLTRIYIDHADSAGVAGWVEIGRPFFPKLAASLRSECNIREAIEIAKSRVAMWSGESRQTESCYVQKREKHLQKSLLCQKQLEAVLEAKIG